MGEIRRLMERTCTRLWRFSRRSESERRSTSGYDSARNRNRKLRHTLRVLCTRRGLGGGRGQREQRRDGLSLLASQNGNLSCQRYRSLPLPPSFPPCPSQPFLIGREMTPSLSSLGDPRVMSAAQPDRLQHLRDLSPFLVRMSGFVSNFSYINAPCDATFKSLMCDLFRCPPPFSPSQPFESLIVGDLVGGKLCAFSHSFPSITVML